MLFQLVFCSQKIFIVHICCCWCAMCVNRDVSSILVCGEAYINWNWLPHKLLLYTKCHIDHLCVASSFCVFKHSLTMLLLVFFSAFRTKSKHSFSHFFWFLRFSFPKFAKPELHTQKCRNDTEKKKWMNKRKMEKNQSEISSFTALLAYHTHAKWIRIKNTLVDTTFLLIWLKSSCKQQISNVPNTLNVLVYFFQLY